MKEVKASITINRKPSEVFEAFTSFEILKGWWGVEKALIEKNQAGCTVLDGVLQRMDSNT